MSDAEDAEYADQGTKLAKYVVKALEEGSYGLLDRLALGLDRAGLSLPEDQGTEYFALMTAFMNEMQQELARALETQRALDAGEI